MTADLNIRDFAFCRQACKNGNKCLFDGFSLLNLISTWSKPCLPMTDINASITAAGWQFLFPTLKGCSDFPTPKCCHWSSFQTQELLQKVKLTTEEIFLTQLRRSVDDAAFSPLALSESHVWKQTECARGQQLLAACAVCDTCSVSQREKSWHQPHSDFSKQPLRVWTSLEPIKPCRVAPGCWKAPKCCVMLQHGMLVAHRACHQSWQAQGRADTTTCVALVELSMRLWRHNAA